MRNKAIIRESYNSDKYEHNVDAQVFIYFSSGWHIKSICLVLYASVSMILEQWKGYIIVPIVLECIILACCILI